MANDATQGRRLVATEYVTLDGVMDEPGKWASPFWSAEAAKFKYDELFASDAMLLGRVTYDGFAQAWPKMEGTGDFGERMNTMPKYVVSTTLQSADWTNSQIIRENVEQEIAALKQQPGMDLLLAGSGKLLRSLMAADLVDEYRLMMHPLVLGSGKRLFEEGLDTKALRHTGTRTFDSGIVVLTYAPKGRGDAQGTAEQGATETVG